MTAPTIQIKLICFLIKVICTEFIDTTRTVFNKKVKFSNSMVKSKCGWSPFHGTQFNGWPVGTIINGNKVFWNGKLIGKPDGKPIKFN